MTPKLLLVEDDPVIATFLADNLTADGYDVLLADTVLDALTLLEDERPDLAVVDVRLREGTGLDLIRRVRAADGVATRLDPPLPILVLSAGGGELDRVRTFERGADDFVAKPSCAVVSRRAERFPSSRWSSASGLSSGTSASSSPSVRSVKLA